MSRQRFLILLIVAGVPAWVMLAYASYTLSQARIAVQEQRESERQAHEDAMRELDALRIEIRRSSEARTRALKALQQEASHR